MQGPNVDNPVATYFPDIAQNGNTATLLDGAASSPMADWISRIAEGNDIVYLLGDQAKRNQLQEIFDANSGKQLEVLTLTYE